MISARGTKSQGVVTGVIGKDFGRARCGKIYDMRFLAENVVKYIGERGTTVGGETEEITGSDLVPVS
ncbi:MAG: hypothetical protein ACE5HC_09315 [Candidatus Binatia bacterium]